VAHAHDRLHEVHALVQALEQLRLVGRSPDVGVGRVGLLLGVAVGQPAVAEPFAHLGPAAELVDEGGVEPRLVDAQVGVDEEAVAIEALDVVALVRGAVTPHVDAVLLHGLDEERPGHGPAQRRGVEVRATTGGDVERAALERHEALVDELRAAVDEARLLGAVLAGAVGHARQVGLVVLAEIRGVGERDRALLAHPGHGRRRVEPAREGDADALSDRQRRQDCAHARPP
jgi:hypothetical protein